MADADDCAESWPWWPAVVYEADDPDIPDKILNQREKEAQSTQEPVFLVRFYDKRRNW